MLRLSTISRSGSEKSKDVTRILDELQRDLKKSNLGIERRRSSLEQLKIYGRDPTDADPIYTLQGIATVAQQAFLPNTSIQASREALSCIANSLLLREQCRQFLAEQNIWGLLIDRLKSNETHDQFLVARIIFIETYVNSGALFTQVMQNHPLVSVVTEKLSQHGLQYQTQSPKVATSPMDDNALTELAKLVFNITKLLPESATEFSPCIPHLLRIIRYSNQAPPQQPLSSVLNALINLDTSNTEWSSSSFPSDDSNVILVKVTDLLGQIVNQQTGSELDNTAAPVVVLISKLNKSAPPSGKKFLQEKLLPSEEDRQQVLGHSKSTSSKLLQLSNSPSVPVLASAISQMLFELSDSDPDIFVENIGLGYASGYLVSQGLPLPGAGESNGTAGNPNINPITGQRLDRETPVDLPPMTDEEKEREAEKLFVLFERLKATGVMDVRNPVADAHRFEEVTED